VTVKKPVPTLASLGKSDEEENQKVDDTSPSADSTSPEVEKADDETAKNDDHFLAPNVVATVPNKTPAELAAETPDETAARYGIDTTITKEDAENPRVQVYEDTAVRQVPSGTHLHPDVAKDLQNRGISQHTTDSAQVRREITDTFDFAPDAEHNDKFVDTREKD
jgi:hypothetical protein